MSHTYSFMDIAASIAGPTGTADIGYGAGVSEEGISIDMAEDKNTMLIGADGQGMHSLHAAKHGTVTVRLLQTSDDNAVLQAMYDAQALDPGAWGKNTLIIRNRVSGDVTTCTPCAFKRKPALNYRKDGTFLEWVFDAIQIDTILGLYT